MQQTSYTIHESGIVDITAGDIVLSGIVPAVDEMPILPFSTEITKNSVVYAAPNGSITLTVVPYGDGISIKTVVSGFENAHDIEPVAAAVIDKADMVYYQGFGMEGPSGYCKIDDTLRRSHGLISIAGPNAAIAIYALDHSKYSAQFSVQTSEGMYRAVPKLTAGINLEDTRPSKDSYRLPDIYILPGTDAKECMSRAAAMIADSMGARTSAEPAYHWCSWYYHYENMSQDILSDFLDKLTSESRLKQSPAVSDLRCIQIDAGYTSHLGDWLLPNHRYPGGLGQAAKTIIESGYDAGIWIAPFIVGDSSDLYKNHPSWVIRDKDGSPHVVFRSYTEPKLWGNTDNDYYVLDTTHPDAIEYLRNVFRTLRSYGFTLYKTDFILWGMHDSSEVDRYDNSFTSVEVLRYTLDMIREEIGQDSYLLGSIAPYMPCIGYMDGMRIASDMGAQWTDGEFGPSNLLHELPYCNYFNNVFWQNDPDSVILRDFASHLSDRETESIALLQALSGGIVTTSDPIERLSDDRLKLLEFIKPCDKVKAEIPFLTEDRDEIVITHKLKDRNLLFILNPTSRRLRAHIDIKGLFGSEAVHKYRFKAGNIEWLGSDDYRYLTEMLEPHASVLLLITEEPLDVTPDNLWG